MIQHFAASLLSGRDVHGALSDALRELSAEILHLVRRGMRTEDALRAFGLAPDLARFIDPADLNSIRLVVGGGGVAGIPTAECLRKNLPDGRDPTEDEIRKAWEACRRP